MNNLTKIVAVILVLLAVLLAIVAFVMGRKAPSAPIPNTAASATYPVVVAAQRLVPGTAIGASQVKLTNLPMLPAGGFTDTATVLGKIPRVAIDPGAPVTEGGLESGLPLQLADGERAIAVPVDEVVGAGNNVQSGDYVDVFFSLRQGPDAKKTQARLLLSRVRVLTYGADSVARPKAASAPAPGRDGGAPPPARTAVLAVPVADVDRLILGTQNGKLMLALRHPTDTAVPDPDLFPAPAPALAAKSGLNAEQAQALHAPDNQAYAGVDMAGLAGDANAKAPAAPRTAPRRSVVHQGGRSIEVIRGTNRENAAL